MNTRNPEYIPARLCQFGLFKDMTALRRNSTPRTKLAYLGVCFCLIAVPGALHSSEAPSEYQSAIRPILEATCFSCHGPEKRKADLDFSAFTDEVSILRKRKVWRKALAKIDAGEMPPEESKQPTPDQKKLLGEWLKRIANVDCNDPANRDPGPPLLRRLTLSEYNHTVHDLMGFDFDATESAGVPDDAINQGFNNLAAALSLPSILMEKYFAAADKMLGITFGSTDPTLGLLKQDNNARKKSQQAYDRLVFVKPGGAVTEHDAAKQVLERFARRAWRRPLSAEESTRLLSLFDALKTKGEAFSTALRMTLKPVLVSPHFLLRIEKDRAANSNAPCRVGDHELATRLSYFIWSTMPDETLSTLADAGKLSEAATLEQQVRRMLADPKARALTDGFGEQWLQLKKLANARPSTEFFPGFTNNLRRAMHDETATYFDKLREEDRSVLEILDSDYTYLNEELASHYGIAGVSGPKMRRVSLKPEDNRGGILGMASILALTSHTSRTSPTMRGKWILDVIYGTPPPPPPANAGQLKEEKDKKVVTTFREQMAKHAADPACASCHKKMDPLGYALESYNAIGAWRSDAALDTHGELPNGDKFNGVRELKKIIVARQDEFLRNLSEQMMTYALGRELDYFDDCVVKDLQAGLKKDGYKFSSLIVGIVNSYPFQYRKNLLDKDAASSKK